MRRRDTAYDGTAHQNFYRDARELVVDGKPMGTPRQPYYVPPAALDPYEFALYDIDMPRSFDVLNDEDTWAMLSDSAIVVGQEMVHGHSCIVIDIEIPGNEQGGLPIMSRVYFGEDLDFFPVQTEWFHVGTGYMYRRYRAWDIVRITNPEGDGIFVNRFGLSRNWKWSGGGEVSSGFLTETDLDTFEINPDLPDSMFTLPVYHALVYDNKLDPSLSFSMPTESNIVRDAFESLVDTPISVAPNSSIEPSAEAAAALFDDDEPLSGRGRKFGLLLMTLVGGAAIVLGVVRQLSSQKVK